MKFKRGARRSLVSVVTALALAAGSALVPAPALAAVSPSISGQVFLGTTETTAPAGDVLVQATRRSDGVAVGTPVPVDASGRYTISNLTPEQYFVRFDYVGTAGYTDSWWAEDDATTVPTNWFDLFLGSETDASVILNLPGSLTGRVSVGTAGVFAGAGEVSIRYRALVASGQWSTESEGAVTDASGNYSIDGLLQGTYLVHFVYLGAQGIQDRWYGESQGVAWSGVPVGPGTPRIVNQLLPPFAQLSGHIYLGSTSTPAGAGDVTITLEEFTASGTRVPVAGVSAVTDANGYYSITGTHTRSYYVTATYTKDNRYARVTTSPRTAYSDVIVQDLTLQPRYTISGTVSIGDSAHPAGAGLEVRLWTNGGSGNPQTTTLTDAAGRYEFTGLTSGVYQIGAFHYPSTYPGLSLWLGGYAPSTYCSLWCGTRVVADTTLDFSIPRFPGASGHVLDSQGHGLDDVTIYADRYSTDHELLESFEFETDENGAWSVPVLAPGNYTFFAVDNTGVHAPMAYDGATFYEDPEVIEVTEDMDDFVVDFELPVSSQLTGRVAGGPPSAFFTSDTVAVEVLVLRAGIWERTDDVWTVDDDRTYFVGDLPPGSYRFEFSYFGPKGYSSYLSGILTFTEGQDRVLNVTLPAPALSNLANDYSGDWLADVLVRDSKGVLKGYLGNGSGRFAGTRPMGSGWNGMNAMVRVGDFDGDYLSDLIARDTAGVLWLVSGNGTGGWLKSTKIGTGWGSFTRLFSPGDFDGDGNVDLIAGTAAGALVLYRGDGVGGWLGKRAIGSGWKSFVSVIPVGDFDGDGNSDVMTRTSNGRLYLYRGNGSGGWAGSRQIGSGWNGFDMIMSPGDFSGDGIPDVLARTPAGALYVYRGNGSGGFAGKTLIGTGWKGLRFVN